jgi:hypothetical protein
MPRLTVGPTELVQWVDLIKDAERHYGSFLKEEVENYLVMVLQRFIQKPEMVSAVLANDYLKAHPASGYLAQQRLRDVGDTCLLFSGLYPEFASVRRVPIKYFIDLGKSSYLSAANCFKHQRLVDQLFQSLAQEFIPMMDVLHCLRELAGVHQQLPIEHAFELYVDVKSEHARQLILKHGGIVPLEDILKLIH